MALTAPLFAATGGTQSSLRVKLSRAATFQSLSLLGICIYLATMAGLATAFRRSQWDWATASTAALLIAMIAGVAAVAISSLGARLAQGEARQASVRAPLRLSRRMAALHRHARPARRRRGAARRRIIKAFADIVEAPGGLLLVSDTGGINRHRRGVELARPRLRPQVEIEAEAKFWAAIEAKRPNHRVRGPAPAAGPMPRDKSIPVPDWMLEDEPLWAGIPLIHHDRLVGIVLLAAPDYRRPLDWEDFDLLRTAGRQAASSLAEAHGQEALADAQRFEEFNRRFAFILHDVKNLVSQLSLARRATPSATPTIPNSAPTWSRRCKGSVGKMNDLLARLSPHRRRASSASRPQPLRPILTAAIAAKRGDHDVRLLGDTNLWAARRRGGARTGGRPSRSRTRSRPARPTCP